MFSQHFAYELTVSGNQVTRKTMETMATNFAMRSSWQKVILRDRRRAFISDGKTAAIRIRILTTMTNTTIFDNVMSDIRRTPHAAIEMMKTVSAKVVGNQSN